MSVNTVNDLNAKTLPSGTFQKRSKLKMGILLSQLSLERSATMYRNLIKSSVAGIVEMAVSLSLAAGVNC